MDRLLEVAHDLRQMVWRILLALIKSAVLVALFELIRSVAALPASELNLISAAARFISNATSMAYKDALLFMVVVITVGLFRILTAMWGTLSVWFQRLL